MSDTLVQHSNNPHNRAIPVYDADLSTEQDSDVEAKAKGTTSKGNEQRQKQCYSHRTNCYYWLVEKRTQLKDVTKKKPNQPVKREHNSKTSPKKKYKATIVQSNPYKTLRFSRSTLVFSRRLQNFSDFFQMTYMTS